MKLFERLLGVFVSLFSFVLQAAPCDVFDPRSSLAQAFHRTLVDPLIIQGPPESKAVRRAGVILEAPGQPTIHLSAEHPGKFVLKHPPGKKIVYDGKGYVEFPNSTMLQTTNKRTGKTRTFILTRGVREYSTVIDTKNGSINPQGYVSDVLVFELDATNKPVYRQRLLESHPESKFLFEDPRISMVHFESGKNAVFLSGTDYSPHVPQGNDPDVMNRYVELKISEDGSILPIALGPDQKPKFKNLSPFPQKKEDGSYSFVDAKNATITVNESNQIVVRTRMRSDPKDYSEQIFVFENMEQFERYNWDHSPQDLSNPTLNEVTGRVKPLVARVVIRANDLKNIFDSSSIVREKGRGLGPGAQPFRVSRVGDKIYVSRGKNAPDYLAATLTSEEAARIGLGDGAVTYISPDHSIFYLGDSRTPGTKFIKRRYDMDFRRWDPTLTNIEANYASALQPLTPLETGTKTGIADLQHVYPMGYAINKGADGLAKVQISVGISDAHTELVEVDVKQLLLEMAPGSERWQSGQIYKPASSK